MLFVTSSGPFIPLDKIRIKLSECIDDRRYVDHLVELLKVYSQLGLLNLYTAKYIKVPFRGVIITVPLV